MAVDDKIDELKLALRAEREAHAADPNAPTPRADDLRSKAEGAIYGGVVGYIQYMRLFAADDTDLAKLLPLEDPLNNDRQKARAYLVRNGVCTMGTGETIGDNVLSRFC